MHTKQRRASTTWALHWFGALAFVLAYSLVANLEWSAWHVTPISSVASCVFLYIEMRPLRRRA